MPYLVDSDWLIYFLDERLEAVTLLTRLLEEDEIAISVISYLEVYQGAIISDSPQEAVRKLDALVDNSPLLTISPAIARRCANLRNLLKSQGKNPHRRAFDLLIAATALEHNLTLITGNIKDYSDIPKLDILDTHNV